MDNDSIEGEVLTPLPRTIGKAITMDFPDAMREVLRGKKVARIEWANKDYGFLKDEWLSIFKDGKVFTHWSVSLGDMEAQDWIIVNESN